MPNIEQGLETKPVFDWEHEPLGTILGSEHDPQTRDPTQIIVGLSADARKQLETEKDTIALPFEYVFGIRRDEVRLNRGVQEIASTIEDASPQEPSPEGDQVLEVPA